MRALITGAAGQDGVIISRKLLSAGHFVYGMCRPHQTTYLKSAVPGIEVVEFELSEYFGLSELLSRIKPDAIVNLAGFSSVRKSWDSPVETFVVNTLVPIQIIEWIFKFSQITKFIQASSSEIFGGVNEFPQNEETALRPITPYGYSKAAVHEMVENFRSRESLHFSNAILYNHESPLRKLDFVTRHIVNGVASISQGRANFLKIGNTSMSRDWGWAPEYVDGIISMLNQSCGNDYVFASGISHTVGEFIDASFHEVGIHDYHKFIVTDQTQIRKVDPTNLVGNSARAKRDLGWNPSTTFEGLISKMMKYELNFISEESEEIWFE